MLDVRLSRVLLCFLPVVFISHEKLFLTSVVLSSRLNLLLIIVFFCGFFPSIYILTCSDNCPTSRFKGPPLGGTREINVMAVDH